MQFEAQGLAVLRLQRHGTRLKLQRVGKRILYCHVYKRGIASISIFQSIDNHFARHDAALIGSFGKFDFRGVLCQRRDHGILILNRGIGEGLRGQRQGERGEFALQREFEIGCNNGFLAGIQRNFGGNASDLHRIFSLSGVFRREFQRQAIGVGDLAKVDHLEFVIDRIAEFSGLRLGRNHIHLTPRHRRGSRRRARFGRCGWLAGLRRRGWRRFRRSSRRWFWRRRRRRFRRRGRRWRRSHAFADIIAMVEMGLQGAFVNFYGLRVIGISWREMTDGNLFLSRFRRWLCHRQHERRRTLGGFRMNRLIRCQPIYRDSSGQDDAADYHHHPKYILLSFHIRSSCFSAIICVYRETSPIGRKRCRAQPFPGN